MNRMRWSAGMAVSLVSVVALIVPSTVAAGATALPGGDISWPQCGQAYPARGAFGIIGVNDGRPYTANPCLVSEYRWALTTGIVEFYMNTANPGVAVGDAYNYGYNAARDAYGYATAHVNAGPGHVWWLDVETGNSWAGAGAANTADIAGSVAFFRAQHVAVGIYSTRYQWGIITGGASIPSVPNWVPGAGSAAEAPAFCTAGNSFSGGPVVMTQYTTQFDYDYLCPGASLPAPLPSVPPPPPNLITAILAWLSSL